MFTSKYMSHPKFSEFVNWYCSTKISKKYLIEDLDFRINKFESFEVYVKKFNKKIFGRKK